MRFMAATKWTIYQISELASSTKNAIAMGPFGSRITKDNFVAAGVPVIRGGNLTDGRFSHHDLVYLTEEKANELSGKHCDSRRLGVYTSRNIGPSRHHSNGIL